MHDEMKNVCFDQSSADHGADGMAHGSTDADIASLQQSVDAGPAHTLLSGRAQADAAHSLAMRPAENVPVYVMLPLDTVRTLVKLWGRLNAKLWPLNSRRAWHKQQAHGCQPSAYTTCMNRHCRTGRVQLQLMPAHATGLVGTRETLATVVSHTPDTPCCVSQQSATASKCQRTPSMLVDSQACPSTVPAHP